ncbi:MAG: phosphodiester glycosidase family protein [Bacteroidales bacterium]|nr:phosphodiester glycosidase family protein [Bacteroidales bacterium]
MKKTFTTLLLAALSCASSFAADTWLLQGTPWTVDTLFHNQVGPGTTSTSLWFRNPADGDALRVFYATMDLTNPYVTLRGVCATDKLAGNETISGMAKRKSKEGERYFVGINADFFVTSGQTNREVSRVGTPVGSVVVDGVIFRARNNAKLYKNFVVDAQGAVYVNPFFFGGTIVAPDGSKQTLGGINTYANEKAASNQNKVTIYNDLYYGGTGETGGCEVAAVLAEGEKFETGNKSFKMKIVGAPSTAGDMDIAQGGYVLHGDGTAASFIANLKDGDEITVSPSWTYGGQSVEPYQIISGNPKILENGVTLQSEGDRGDASARHPRSAVGYSHDGKKVYFLVVDGRSLISSGVRTTWLADIMRYAGATDGMNVDGGGSSVLYTSTLGVRNKPSDGRERADGNAFYAVSSAPDDDQIASIRFIDFALKSPKYGVYTPRFYGYNQYGMLVSQDVKGVTLSCDPSLGTIIGDTTFYADGTARDGMLTATYQGATISAPVQIIDAVDAINITNDSIIADGLKEYPVAVQTIVGETAMHISPQALTWKSLDESIVAIGEHTGLLKGLRNGKTQVVGVLGEICDTMEVNVEIPEARVMPIDPNLDVATWKFSQTGGKDVVVTAVGNGFDYTYTGASGRAPKIVLSKTFRLWSLPDVIRVRVNPGEAPMKNFVFGLRARGGAMIYHTITPDVVKPNEELVVDLPTSAWCDATDMGNYPITLNSIQINMNTSTTGQVYDMHFLGFETVYLDMPEAPAKKGDINADGEVNVSDVTALINKILGIAEYADAACDINADGQVNVSDVTALINMILG